MVLIVSGSVSAQDVSRFYVKNMNETLEKASLIVGEVDSREFAYIRSLIKQFPNNLTLYANNTYKFSEEKYGISKLIFSGGWRKNEDGNVYIEYEGDEIEVNDNDNKLSLYFFEYDSKKIYIHFNKERGGDSSPIDTLKKMPYIGTYVSYTPEVMVYKFYQDGTFYFSTKTGIIQSNISGKYIYSYEGGVEKVSVKANILKNNFIISKIGESEISISWNNERYEYTFHEAPNWIGAARHSEKPDNIDPFKGTWLYSNKKKLTQSEYFLVDMYGDRYVNELNDNGYVFYPAGKVRVNYNTIPFQVEYVDFLGRITQNVFEFITEDIIRIELYEVSNSQSNSPLFRYAYRVKKETLDLSCKDLTDNTTAAYYDLTKASINLDEIINESLSLMSRVDIQQKFINKYKQSERVFSRPDIKHITDDEYRRKRDLKLLNESKKHSIHQKQLYKIKVVSAFDKAKIAYQVYSSMSETFNIPEFV